jgi:hypothetical protein
MVEECQSIPICYKGWACFGHPLSVRDVLGVFSSHPLKIGVTKNISYISLHSHPHDGCNRSIVNPQGPNHVKN